MVNNNEPGIGRTYAGHQVLSNGRPRADLWVKRDLSTGRFMKAKKNGGSFRGVRRER